MTTKKDLRPKTQREITEEFIKSLQDSLEAAPVMFREDFESKLPEYEQSLNSIQRAPKTISKYTRNAAWFVENYTSNEKPLEMSDLLKFKSQLQKDYDSVQTINSYVTTINRFLFYCEQGAFKVDKVKGQTNNVLPDRLHDYEVRAMYRKAKQLGLMDLHYIIKILSQTGIRVAERDFVTLESCERLEIKAKNKGKTRSVPIPQELARELRKYAKQKNITSGKIIDLSYSKINRGLKRIAGLCKIKKAKVHPHALRHYFAFRYVELKGNIAQLADILGHSSTDTTRGYTKGTIADYRKQVEGM